MENKFIVNGKECRVTLDKTGLTWRLRGSSQGSYRVPVSEIISCWCCPKGSLKCCPIQEDADKNFTKNEGLTNGTRESNLSTISTTALLRESNTEIHYGGVETNLASQGQSSSVHTTDDQFSRKIPFPASVVKATGEDTKLYSSYRPNERLTGLPLINHCIHSSKLETSPTLAVEICERVLPSQHLAGCFRGDGEPMVTTWKSRVLVFQHESSDTISSWHKSIWEVVAGNPSRPRHLLVIVNPMSGKKTSERLYKSKIAPLLLRAAIRVTFRKTTHCGHGEELAEEAATSGDVDGVVTVSGDGTVAEVVTGLIKTRARQLGVPFDARDTALPKTNVALGVIPSGSTNTYIVSCHGTEDETTSVLQIIMGTRRYVHVGGLYVDDKLEHVSQVGIQTGFLARALETSTRLRHMGPSRDIIACVKEFFMNRSCLCEIRYWAEGNEHDLLQLDAPVCRAECLTCRAAAADGSAEGEWVEIKGDYNMAAWHLVRAECRYSKYGVSPMCHVNNGYCDVVLNPKGSRLSCFFRLFRLGATRDHLTKAPVQAFRTREIRFRFLTPSSPSNCDGELKYYQEFVFKMHRQCVPLYSRGREPVSTLDLPTLTNNFK